MAAAVAATMDRLTAVADSIRSDPARRWTHDRIGAFAARKSRTVPAGAIVVTNCNDSGPGSLRDAVSLAATGSSIDLTSMGCSTITLTTGAIVASQDDLALQGVASATPGYPLTTIAGDSSFQPLIHVGHGTLALYDLRITNGRDYNAAGVSGDANGGCIVSFGTVALTDARVDSCVAATFNPAFNANGGAIYATDGVMMIDSRVGCSIAGGAHGSGGGIATPGLLFMSSSTLYDSHANGPGGGAVTTGGFLAKYSSISGNTAEIGGAIAAAGDIAIERSIIAGNQAFQVAGAFLANTASGYPTTIRDSTVAYNFALDSFFLTACGLGLRVPAVAAPDMTASTVSGTIGGIALFGDAATIANSTIALNSERNVYDQAYGAGLYFFSGVTVDLQSTIIASNYLVRSAGPLHDDIGVGPTGGTVNGANNLIQAAVPPLTIPADTLNAEPMLFRLNDNGGPTLTLALMAGSPAIDAGNDAASLMFDQRGAGFARVVGATADIGAFERQEPLDGDRIFADGFD